MYVRYMTWTTSNNNESLIFTNSSVCKLWRSFIRYTNSLRQNHKVTFVFFNSEAFQGYYLINVFFFCLQLLVFFFFPFQLLVLVIILSLAFSSVTPALSNFVSKTCPSDVIISNPVDSGQSEYWNSTKIFEPC